MGRMSDANKAAAERIGQASGRPYDVRDLGRLVVFLDGKEPPNVEVPEQGPRQ